MLRWGLDFRRERRMVVARNCLIPSCSMANEVCIETDIIANRYDMVMMRKLLCMSWTLMIHIAQLMEKTYLPIIFTDESGSGSLGLPGFDETHNLCTTMMLWDEGIHNWIARAGCSSMEFMWWSSLTFVATIFVPHTERPTNLVPTLSEEVMLALAICRGRTTEDCRFCKWEFQTFGSWSWS